MGFRDLGFRVLIFRVYRVLGLGFRFWRLLAQLFWFEKGGRGSSWGFSGSGGFEIEGPGVPSSRARGICF